MRFWIRRDIAAAVRLIDDYLVGDLAVDVRSGAFAFRARLKREMGDWQTAQQDYVAAHLSSEEGSYHRYTVELALGSLCEDRDQKAEALSWYTRAMRTAILDPGTSGAAALEGLLDIKGSQPLSDEETDLCTRIVQQAWALFRLQGEPELDDLRGTIEALKEASTRPLPR